MSRAGETGWQLASASQSPSLAYPAGGRAGDHGKPAPRPSLHAARHYPLPPSPQPCTIQRLKIIPFESPHQALKKRNRRTVSEQFEVLGHLSIVVAGFWSLVAAVHSVARFTHHGPRIAAETTVTVKDPTLPGGPGEAAQNAYTNNQAAQSCPPKPRDTLPSALTNGAPESLREDPAGAAG